MKKYLFLLFFICATPSFSMPTPLRSAETIQRSAANQFQICRQLDLLYTSLYGRNHPLKKTIQTHEAFIKAYRSLSSRSQGTTLSEEQITAIEESLNRMTQDAQSILQQYQLQPYPLPQQQPFPYHMPQQVVSSAHHTTPTTQDHSLHQYLSSVSSTQNHFMEFQKEMQHHSFKEQIILFSLGTAIIAGLTLVGKHMLRKHIREQKSILHGYEQINNEMDTHLATLQDVRHKLGKS